MKRTFIILAALTALMGAGCQRLEEQLQPEESAVQADTTWTVTIRAEIPYQDEIDGATKSIVIGDEESEANTTSLKTLWESGNHVYVYLGDEVIGQLSVAPDQTDAHFATLSGTVTTSGITPGVTRLTLMNQLYRSVWTYDGQCGLLRFDDYYHIGGSISSGYNYTRAEDVLVTAVEDGHLSTASATFKNAQSIYRLSFRFQNGGVGDKTAITATRAIISSENGKIWRNAAQGYGPLTVELSSAKSTPFFVAIRNDDTTNEEALHFQVVGNDGVTYLGSKTIPAQYKPNGKFVSIKNCTLTGRMGLAVSSEGGVDTAL